MYFKLQSLQGIWYTPTDVFIFWFLILFKNNETNLLPDEK